MAGNPSKICGMGKIIPRAVWLTVSVTLTSLLSCSFSGQRDITFRFPKGALPRASANSRTNYDCYLVNVSGPGISPTVGSQNIGTFAPSCIDVGVSSPMLSLVTLEQVGVSLKIPSGSKRKVEVFGIKTTIAGSCVNQPLERLFENGKQPELYSLAKATDQNIFVDRKIVIHPSSSAANPENVLLNCAKGSPTKTPPTSAISSVSVVLFNSSIGNTVQPISFEPSAGTLTLSTYSFSSASAYSHFKVTPDNQKIFAWESNAGMNQSFFLVKGGVLEQKAPVQDMTLAKGKTDLVLTDNSAYGFLFGNNGTGFLKSAASGFIGNGTPDATIPLTVQRFSKGNFIYAVGDLPTTVNIQKTAITDLGTLPLNPPYDSAGFEISGGNPIPNSVLVRPEAIYVAYTNDFPPGVYVQALTQNNVGNLVLLGVPQPIGSPNDGGQTAIAISPTRNFFFVKRYTGSTSKIDSYEMNIDGSVGKYVSYLITPNFVDFAVDPTGRYLIVAMANGGNCQLVSYRIETNGALSLVSSLLNLPLGILGLAVTATY